MRFKHDTLNIECLIPSTSKAVSGLMDIHLLGAFGLTDLETDFPINCDIKYRMGAADTDEE